MNRKQIKEEMRQVVDEYYNEYKIIPPENISDEEWNIVFSVLYNHFCNRKNKNDYIYALNIVVRHALVNATMRRDAEFNIDHILNALNDLVAFHIYGDEIETIKDEINSRISKHLVKKHTQKRTI